MRDILYASFSNPYKITPFRHSPTSEREIMVHSRLRTNGKQQTY